MAVNKHWGRDLPPLPWASYAMSALHSMVSLLGMALASQWDSLLQESLLESHLPIVSITISVSLPSCIPTHADPSGGLIAPRKGKVQEQHQQILNSVLLGRFVLAAWSSDEFIESALLPAWNLAVGNEEMAVREG